eukprot:CAMPEP_0115833656 /NCGR_PEP_ID=MMETSP0287-20121206/3284_1 /TAXON_ID=412157 /ORGANISM="Chrysochromulina rotalis, Strain UIO044" /LENGTH=134 /DNA_ID=CAMNT_0003287075 /DNA_START=81 /DNA_END=486 /DNA_ORIENTATION=+
MATQASASKCTAEHGMAIRDVGQRIVDHGDKLEAERRCRDDEGAKVNDAQQRDDDEPMYASVARRRAGANMPAHCRAGPTRKQYEQIDRIFPTVYLNANGPGWPSKTPANDDMLVNESSIPKQKQKAKPRMRDV